MLPDVQSVLVAAMASIMPTPPNVYRTQAAEGTVAPYLVWSIVAAVPENNVSCSPETDNARIQVDAYSTSQPQARQLCELAQAAIEATSANVIFGPVETREPDTKFWRWMFHSSHWTPR